MSARQFYIIFIISVITMKMHKLPGIMFGEIGKDCYILFLIYGLVNVVGIFIGYFILKRLKIGELSNNKNLFFKVIYKLFAFLALVYFIFQALLVYEHVQDLYSHTLFDNLSWALFSWLLLFTVFYLAHRGIKNIALNHELYVWLVLGSIIVLTILGFSHSDFSYILPLETININNILSKFQMFNLWFGDFFLLIFLGQKAEKIKLSKILLIYTLTILFLTFMLIEFLGTYKEYSSVESGMVSVISDQSMLGLNIGRFDWFLILFCDMGAILSCSVYIYYANQCAEKIFSFFRPIFVKIGVILIIYIIDVFYLIDVHTKIKFFCSQINIFSLLVQIIIVLVLFVLALNKKEYPQNLKGTGR